MPASFPDKPFENFPPGNAPQINDMAFQADYDYLKKMKQNKETTNIIYFAGGCFWGPERFFKLIKGVVDTEVGYAGCGQGEADFIQAVNGTNGFVEAVKVTYDPLKIGLSLLLELFFKAIDLTTLDSREETESLYDTGIFFTGEDQLPAINRVMANLSRLYGQTLDLKVCRLMNYFPAEEYHQNYLDKNPGAYCQITPDAFELVEDVNKWTNL